MSTIIPKIHQEPKEEIEEETDINENDYFKESDNLKIKIEKIKNQDNESEEKEEKEEKNNIIDDDIKPEKKPKRKYTMSQKRLDSLEKARKYSAEKRRQNKKEKETLEAIKNDTMENQLKTELSDYKKTLLEVHNKNKDLEEQIKELKNLKINKPQPKIEKEEPIYQSPQNPINQKYTFEEMEYYSQERYKQLKQQDDDIYKKNNTDQIQRLRDKYLLNMR